MKKLFYLLLALPLAFAACEQVDDGVNEPVDTPTEEPALNLGMVSATFPAEGELKGEISYTIENPVEGVELEVSCEAAWISNLAVGQQSVTFDVAVNEGEERNTHILFVYGDIEKQFAVTQMKREEPQNQKIEITASYLQGDYYGDEYAPGVGNYFVTISDLGLDENGYAQVLGNYFVLDLYGPMFEGEGSVTLPVGTYNFDATDSMAMWTIGNEYTAYSAFDESGNCTTGEEGARFSEATLVVTESDVTLTAIINGDEYIVVFAGEADIVDYTAEVEPITMDVDYAYAYYLGDEYAPGEADNFYFFLSDLGLDEEGYEKANGNYYRFDIYTDIVDTTNGIVMPDGEYVLDMTDSCTPGTFTNEYSVFYSMDEYAYDYADVAYYAEGHLVKEGNKITATVVIRGAVHIISFEGDVVIYDSRTTEDDPEQPEDPENPENPTPGEGMSTLTGDIELDITNAAYALQYYGDYFSYDTDNWMLYIYEDTVTMNGAFIMLDFLSDPYADDIAGTYTADDGDDSYAINTYFPGYVDGDDMYGVWYTEMVEGVDITALAPIADGEIKIECAGNTYTITFDCVDDKGNKITGTIVANPLSEEPMAAALSVKKPAKQSRKASVEKVVLESVSAKQVNLIVR